MMTLSKAAPSHILDRHRGRTQDASKSTSRSRITRFQMQTNSALLDVLGGWTECLRMAYSNSRSETRTAHNCRDCKSLPVSEAKHRSGIDGAPSPLVYNDGAGDPAAAQCGRGAVSDLTYLVSEPSLIRSPESSRFSPWPLDRRERRRR